MLVPVCALVHVVQAALAAPDVQDVLLHVQVTALVHALVVQAVLVVALVVLVAVRVDALILVGLNVPDVADVQLVVVGVVLLGVLQVVVLVQDAQIHVLEVAKVNALQLVEDVSLVREHVLQVAKAHVLVVLGVTADVCIRVLVDALLAVTNVAMGVQAVVLAVRDAQDVPILVMGNVADALAAVKVVVIVTVLLLVPDAMDVLILVQDVVALVTLAAGGFVLDAKVNVPDVQVPAQEAVVHHVKLPALDALDVLAAAQHLAQDVADVQETALVDAKGVRETVVPDALVAVQHHVAIVAKQAALLPVTPIAQEHAMAHAPTRMCHLLNKLTV